jgi:hypothetical protein
MAEPVLMLGALYKRMTCRLEKTTCVRARNHGRRCAMVDVEETWYNLERDSKEE